MNLEKLIELFDVLREDVEQYITSVTYEETRIEVNKQVTLTHEEMLEGAVKTDIFLYARDTEHNADIVILMDEAWFGLLSSIMLGIEEKALNEVTRDLLLKFGNELKDILVKKLAENDLTVKPENLQVLTAAQLENELTHTQYFGVTLAVHGVADDDVRAGIILGDPAAIKVDEPEPVEEPEAEATNGDNANGTKTNGKSKPSEGEEEMAPDEMVNAQRVEFVDFGEATNVFEELDGTNIELLKDVNLDVSVELGQIQMPLGKVLQLTKGAVLELDKLAGEPVDILVNGHRIAQGEVVVIDEHFGVRIVNLVSTRERLAKAKLN
ncbi:MAG: flagellar motor switch protein FliN [Bacteroidetes bacterium]|nr:flagellar motor switch protein FliN [Bacteroidota bacterium]MCH8523822.1 flagellar motor switch protein FliN [Balneolales bacterium]